MVLHTDIEEEIVVWLNEMAHRGFGHTKPKSQESIKLYLDSNGRTTQRPNNAADKIWYRLFRKGHPDIVLRKPQKLGKSRDLIIEAMVADWFQEMKATICSIDPSILLDPTRIYSADEVGFSLDAQTGKVLARSESRFIYQVAQDHRTMIIVFISCSAAAHFSHPTQFRRFTPLDLFKQRMVAN
ncbi:tigger transposable element-derived protein 6-like protein [Plakobranchus ocellatus]|uniref:Tigger transposable element-derived protein 6-like protein n=1 Tax=Plakobranchus ocellatus TaxID=259542 RepID=A0AAV4B1S2_9GAST|nr:tigger transposable element-derived protein 6-like protein [Plakobranchus ocellatus]